MVPTSSLSQMFEIINNESKLKSYRTEQLLEFLDSLQNESIKSPFPCCFKAFEPVECQSDMKKIIRIENALIDELQERGISCSRRKFS